MPRHAHEGPELPPDIQLALAVLPPQVDPSIARELPTLPILATAYAARMLLNARIEYGNFAADFAEKKGELVREHALDRAKLEREMNERAAGYLTKTLVYSQSTVVPSQTDAPDEIIPSREATVKLAIDEIEADHSRHGLTRQEAQIDLPPKLKLARATHDMALKQNAVLSERPDMDLQNASSPEELEEIAARVQFERGSFSSSSDDIHNFGELSKKATTLMLDDMDLVARAIVHAATLDGIDAMLTNDDGEAEVLFNTWQASIEALDQCTQENWYRQRMAALLGHALDPDQGLPRLPTFAEWLPGHWASLNGKVPIEETEPVFPADVSDSELVVVSPDEWDRDD